MNTSKTPLYYAEILGLTGLCFAVGPTLLFAPTEADTLHVVHDTTALVLTAEVPDLFADHLRMTVIERRLAHLAEGAR
jgi:hypothetical protein